MLMGKALKRTVVFLLAGAPALTSTNILCNSGQTKYYNTANRGLRGKQAARDMFQKLRVERELQQLIFGMSAYTLL